MQVSAPNEAGPVSTVHTVQQDQPPRRRKPPAAIEHETLGSLRVPVYHDVLQAMARIVEHTLRTPLLRSARLDALCGGRVWIKPENLQHTGSFKLRGALNALCALDAAQLARGVVAYSTGNHGQAAAYAARLLGARATIVMPQDAPQNKVAKARGHGAEVVLYDRRHESREEIGARLVAHSGAVLIPPGDHPDVIAGQGTLALEALRDMPHAERNVLEAFVAPCGGGGMLAGCGLVIEQLQPSARLIAAEPAACDDTARSLRSGRRESNPEGAATICDALLARTPAQLPFAINRKFLDAVLTVSDAEVGAAIRFALHELRLVIEPGGAVALAAACAGRLRLQGGSALLVLSGGNIDLPLLEQLLA